jgi:DNA-binding transcriptional ArsR family regulator
MPVIVNQMVHYQQGGTLDRSFAALADPTRRRILRRLGSGPATISELAEPIAITLTGLRKHVRVLEDAGLVRTAKVGRTRRCELGRERLERARSWIDDYQRALDERYERLDELLAEMEGEEDE